MKIINGKQLGFMPNGTVFSDISDEYFRPNGGNGDMTINMIYDTDSNDYTEHDWVVVI